MAHKKPTTETEQLQKQRLWPKGIPMPKAGAYNANSLWTYDEEELLRKYYPQYGSIYCSRLLGRTMDAVKIRASRLSLISNKSKRQWTNKEITYLRRWFGKRSNQEIAQALGRSMLSIRQRSVMLGIHTAGPKPWSKEHLTLLRKHYGRKSLDELVQALGRKRHTIVTKASKLRLTKQRVKVDAELEQYIVQNAGKIGFNTMAANLGISPRRVADIARRNGFDPEGSHINRWSEEDRNFLRDNYSTMPLPEIAKHVGRSRSTVYAYATTMGLSPKDSLYGKTKRWSPDELELLRKLYGTMSTTAIATQLGHTPRAVKARIKDLGLVEQHIASEEKWKRTEDALLRELYSTNSIQKIAHELKRSVMSVRHRVAKLKLERNDSPLDTPWTTSEDAKLRRLYPKHNNREIGRRMSRSLGSVQHRARHLGLHKPPTMVSSLWTKEEEATVRKLFGTMTTSQIAQRLNRPVGSVRGKLRSIGLKKFSRRRRIEKEVDGG